jgi:Ran GTPase-activating protein (RanGAP) involved in mRNA processing and transport
LDDAALHRIARSPSHRGPRAADVFAPTGFVPPTVDSPLTAWAAKDVVERDGEVVALSLSGRAFISLGEPLVRKLPWLEQVRLVAVAPYLNELAATPHLARVRHLDLRGNRIGPAGMRALAGSPFLGSLTALTLSDNDLGPAGIDELLRAPWRRQLQSLDVAGNGLTAEAVRKLCDDPAFADLVELDLSRNGLPPAVGGFLPRTAVVCLLRTLSLADNPIGPGGAAAFCAGSRLDRLRELNLANCGLGAAGAAAVADAESLVHLTDLDLAFNDIGDDGAAVLGGPWRRLSLRGNRIGPGGAVALASATFDRLDELDLSSNPLGDVPFDGFPRLTSLNLANTGRTDIDPGTLVGLERLSLAWNCIGDDGVTMIARSPEAASLVELNLTGCRFGARGARALLEANRLTKLRHLTFDEHDRLPTDMAAALRARYQ